MTVTKEFWILVDQGLCNRFRVFLSAIGFCELTKRHLVICWPLRINTGITERIQRILSFQPDPARFQACISDLWQHQYREASLSDWKQMLKRPEATRSTFPPDAKCDANLVYLETIHAFFHILPHSPKEYVTTLQLIPELSDRVRRFSDIKKGHWPLIGIHIRSNCAHPNTITHSPLSWFEKRIEEMQGKYPNALFYLSCDSAFVSTSLLHSFPGLIYEHCRPPAYNSRAGIQKALVDLYILAKMDYILGSYYSSFSSLACYLQGEVGYEDSKVQIGTLPQSVEI